jgi:hypothetical protein
LRAPALRTAAPHDATLRTAVLRTAVALLWCAAVAGVPARATEPASAPSSGARVEARSAELLAVGTVQGGRMVIHLTRIADNAPVRDAAVTVLLRGTARPAVAEADGSYSLQTPDLELPGTAAVEFQIVSGTTRQDLTGTLEGAGRVMPGDVKGSTRQLGWWILNFAVCIGFLMLWSRRKKRDAGEERAP